MSETFNFEAAMKRLAEIATLLEKDDLSLDNAIALFDEGLQLSKQCQTRLTQYETTVKELVQKHQGE
ncbi:exodeoxyribonuclease VII small subunit [Erysipelothrix sp. HDW6B]|uniref:exodeoxyribonuclease VII small subunit n=1 Tax=Erysipelothrix TaxID=1647 RepID=UPI001356BCA5|nr:MULTISPECIES: exodeoxyribonuclease VII small subunit [Erysipelothrix]QIK86182.1 exodeoxyribonuclease VII small subunit [Erysipelothrix sp. HDW6B]